MFPSTSWEKVLSFSRDPMFVESQIKVLIQDLLRIGLLRPNECHCCSTETVLTNTGFYSLQVTWELRGGEAQVMGCMLSHFSRVQLFATPWIVARQAPLSMRILQARILEWVAIPSSNGSFWPRDQTHIAYVSCIGRRVLYHLAPPGKLPGNAERLLMSQWAWDPGRWVTRQRMVGPERGSYHSSITEISFVLCCKWLRILTSLPTPGLETILFPCLQGRRLCINKMPWTHWMPQSNECPRCLM